MELLVAVVVALISGSVGGGLVKWGQDRWTSKRQRRTEILAAAREGASEISALAAGELPRVVTLESVNDDPYLVDEQIKAARGVENAEWFIDIRDELSDAVRTRVEDGPFASITNPAEWLQWVAVETRKDIVALERRWKLR